MGDGAGLPDHVWAVDDLQGSAVLTTSGVSPPGSLLEPNQWIS